MMPVERCSCAVWPALPVDAWTDTRTTVHLWTQIVGKIRMANTPVVNHWWNVTLYVTTTGLTTQTIVTVVYSGTASGGLIAPHFLPMMAPQGGIGL